MNPTIIFVVFLLVSMAAAGPINKKADCTTKPCKNCDDAKLLDNGCYSCVCDEYVLDDMHLTADQWKQVEGWVKEKAADGKAAGALINKWPKSDDGKVRIMIHLPFETVDLPQHVNVIVRAINIINARTCFRIGEGTGTDDYMLFINNAGCFSRVGRYPGGQVVSIGRGCGFLGIVEHEIYHALGFYHEQSRPDRDEYVKIKWKNIRQDRKDNFFKEPADAIDSFGSEYDKKSVMHYGGYDFTKNGGPTIIDKATGEAIVTQSVSVSAADLYQLNQMYECGDNVGVPFTTHCYHRQDYGTGYRGNVSTTESGFSCQRWDATTPNPNQFSPDVITAAGLEENYCRNPDGFDKPWCYVDSDVKIWEYCDIPECNNDTLFMIKPPNPIGDERLYWSAWSDWSLCYPECSDGKQHRTRACLVNDTSLCKGDSVEMKNCTEENCNGKWDRWQPWSSCSKPCGEGKKYRVRQCENGQCNGRAIAEKSCEVQDCPLYPGGDCADPEDVNSYRGNISVAKNGHNCKPWSETNFAGSPLVEENFCRNPNNRTKSWPWCYSARNNKRRRCEVPLCPKNPFWKRITKWSACTQPCGGGKKYRTRSCRHGEVTQGKCSGSVIREMPCNEQSCEPGNPTVTLPQATEGVGCVNLSSISSYRGQASKTLDGISCQYWDAQMPHRHRDNTVENIENLGLVENYCRVLSEYNIYPICLTNARTTSYATCDIPMCKPEVEEVPPIGCQTPGQLYMGGMNTTRSGYTCQRWDVNYPHIHDFKPSDPVMRDRGIGPHNYCRGPLFDGPWCYTTDPHKRFEYCDVPLC